MEVPKRLDISSQNRLIGPNKANSRERQTYESSGLFRAYQREKIRKQPQRLKKPLLLKKENNKDEI